MRLRRKRARTTALSLPALVALSLVLATPVVGAAKGIFAGAAAAWRASFAESAQTPHARRMIVVLAAPSLADRLEPHGKMPTSAVQRRWTDAAKRSQRALLAALARRGLAVKPEYSFTRTVNGFSALLDARGVAELERSPGVVGVFPARTVLPASVPAEARSRPEFGGGAGGRPEVSLRGSSGNGVTIALLDTGVALGHPHLRGRVLRGVDVIGRDGLAAAEPKPDDRSRLEAHGTRMAGIVVGAGGPDGLRGVAPGARVLPVRVLGWQQGRDGTFQVFGYGDQLVAGLERAVDPDGDGDVDDAARIALAPVFAPYAAFPGSPEARAVRGATRLGTLVVAASGNDGRGGAASAAIGAPGGAPAALTVGAIDSRRAVLDAETVLRVGLTPVFEGAARIIGLPPAAPLALPVTALRGPTLADPGGPAEEAAPGDELREFFDPRGLSVVAGRAVLLPADGAALEARVQNAAAAGAAAVVVYGDSLPRSGLDLEESASIPVLGLPEAAGRAAVSGLARGANVSLSVAAVEVVPNPAFGRVADFSSRGPAFDGRVKPDVVAPGVAIATADAGTEGQGPRYATVTGSSAAAALVAGSAALLADARPGLRPLELKSALVGSARQLVVAGRPQPPLAQGAGVVDVRGADAATVAVEPVTLALGRARGPRWRATRSLTVRNLSPRPLELAVAVAADSASADPVAFAAEPSRLSLAPRASARVEIVAAASERVRSVVTGSVVVAPGGGPVVRVPWAILPPRPPGPLVGGVRLSHSSFEPSPSAPAVLAFRAGRVARTPEGRTIEPVAKLDVELWNEDGERLGVLARLRHLLPGRYAFGLTGRGPAGNELSPGTYVIRLRAQPVGGRAGTESTARAVFTIER